MQSESGEWLTLKEAALYTKYSTRTLRAAAASGALRTVQAAEGGHHRTKVGWVDAWLRDPTRSVRRRSA